jgi:hypothetical protein
MFSLQKNIRLPETPVSCSLIAQKMMPVPSRSGVILFTAATSILVTQNQQRFLLTH